MAVLGVLAAGALVYGVQGGSGAAPVATLVGADAPDQALPTEALPTPSATPSTSRPAPRPAQPGAEKDGPAVPAPASTSAPAEGPAFENCTEVWDAGEGPINESHPRFQPGLDRGGEPGVGCEEDPR